jgi:hypothetical protein
MQSFMVSTDVVLIMSNFLKITLILQAPCQPTLPLHQKAGEWNL